ncbi:MAG: glycosyltransferase family 2 protein [Proteobacteria bacterium]|nr:glycosyltransferase family 2 protein [Pseudomonadota bacterium]
MKPITVITPYSSAPRFEKTLHSLTESGLVENVIILSQEPVDLKMDSCRVLAGSPLTSKETLEHVLTETRTKYLLILPGAGQVSFEPEGLERMLDAAESTKAGMVYSDFYEEGKKEKKILRPLNDYQMGSVRDDFNFGSTMLFLTEAIKKAFKKYGGIPQVQYAGIYALRLKVSIEHQVHHLQESLYTIAGEDDSKDAGKHFAYVDPRNQSVQKEMELVFTDYLRKIGAYLPAGTLRKANNKSQPFSTEASIIIPVKNRKGTISDAVKSAFSQETDFPFNVIVVDNHSTDGTTSVLSGLATQYPALKLVIPARTDLGIGGCWNEAIYSDFCGRYMVQLDSDDLYAGTDTLRKIVDMLREGNYAMVIGSYTIVNFNLEVIPPGLIDHSEWTYDNGHNNALRVNGLGAPRAFSTSLMRKTGFIDVSYGEDYAAALRISREYLIGRIYESLYLCRRWEGNTDAALSVEESNRNDAFKDKVRTDEILARQEMNNR